MPGAVCSVKTCKNTSRKHPELSFHTFPKEPTLRSAWIQFCRQEKEWIPKKSSTICSAHFLSCDFELNFRKTLMNTPTRPQLKRHAVPWIFDEENKEDITSIQQEADKTRHNLSSKVVADNTNVLAALASQELQHTGENSNFEEKCKLQHENNLLLKEIENLKKYNNNLIQLQEQTSKKCQQLERELAEYKNNSILKKNLEDEIKNSLQGVLSSAQIDLILQKKKKVRWSHDDIARAFTLRYFSQRAYTHMRENNYPLPDLSTLRKYASKINMRNGVLHDVLKMMQIMGQDMKAHEKAVVLMYDEMKVSSVYEYDKQKDEIVGPHSQMQVVLARGLLSHWKQPVFIDFDTKMTGSLLLEIISSLQNIGYKVMASISYCGSDNQGVWRDFDVSTEKTHFLETETQQPIYCFGDAPRLIKLIRNWLLDTGFILDNGVIITKEPLRKLIEMGSNIEVSATYGLQLKHLNCTGSERENVLLATQLLSHSTAVALRRYIGTEEALALSQFIEIVNSWFDLMTKKPYEALSDQNKVLSDMSNLMLTSLCCGKSSLQVFQKVIIMSCKSLQELFKRVSKEFPDTKCLLTSKLNEDALENLFSQIRTPGGLDDHPTPLNALYRLRLIMLGKSPGIVQERANYEPSTSNLQDEYVLGKIFKATSVKPIFIKTDTPDVDLALSSLVSSSLDGENSEEDMIEKLEEDGLEYLAGWLARKFNKQYPYLGQYPYMLQHDHDYCLPSRVNLTSYGGLTEASSELLFAVEKLNKHFKQLNKGTFKIKDIVERLHRKLKPYVTIPEEVTKAFIKQRIFIRMKYLNKKIK